MRTSIQKRSNSSRMATKERNDSKRMSKKSVSASPSKSRGVPNISKNEDIDIEGTEEKPWVAKKKMLKTFKDNPDDKENDLDQSDEESGDEDDKDQNPPQSLNIPTAPKITKKVKDPVKKSRILKEENSVREKFQTGPGLFTVLGYAMAVIVVVLGVISAPLLIPEELKPYILAEYSEENTKFNYVKIFDNTIRELKTQFPNQTSRFWKILKTRGSAHLNDKKPKQPLVILMGAPPSAHNVIDCMAWKIAETLDPGNDNIGYINGASFSKYGGDEAKKLMDQKLEKLFQKGDRSALVLHLELLPPPSPILFYSYCDNDNAPFKHAGIIFTVHLPEEPNLSLSPAEKEGIIEQYLSEVAWSKYPYEQDAVSALLSRIADTVALVSGETDEALYTNNCHKYVV